jgi:hypothetical protein
MAEAGEGKAMAAGGETVVTDDFLLVVPPGWQRTDDGSAPGTITIAGPEVDGGAPELGLYAEALNDPDIAVEEWSDQALTEFADVPWTEDDRDATVCGQPAREVAFTSDGSDVAMYLCVLDHKGFVVVTKAPEGTMGSQHDAFMRVLETLEIYGRTGTQSP